MIRRSLFFANPAQLSLRQNQLVVQQRTESGGNKETLVPIEDLGYVVLESQQITFTQALLARLCQEEVAVIFCNDHHLPVGVTMPLAGHSEFSERVRAQTEASQPLKKQLWQQLVTAKVENQGKHLEKIGQEIGARRLGALSKEIRSGDPTNVEAAAAAYYWRHFLPDRFEFYRKATDGSTTNIRLNYGYAILRAAVGRALCGSGLLPVLGVFHQNKYNAYCLADDVMEPYRPFVDAVVRPMAFLDEDEPLPIAIKRELVELLASDVVVEGRKSPMMVAIQRTTASLAKCYLGETKELLVPTWPS